MHIGMAATIDAKNVVAKRNEALSGSGGMLYLSNVNAATLSDCSTVRNKAGTNGGGIAVFDCSRSTTTITNSVVEHNQAGESGGGVFALNSKVDVIGVQITDNSADLKNGGGLATSGTASLELRDVPCVDVEVLLDWNAAGSGCPVLFDDSSGDVDSYNCDTGLSQTGASSCHNLEAFHSHHSVNDDAYTCSGCTCNNEWVWGCVLGCCALALLGPFAIRLILLSCFFLLSGGETSSKSTLLFKQRLTVAWAAMMCLILTILVRPISTMYPCTDYRSLARPKSIRSVQRLASTRSMPSIQKATDGGVHTTRSS